MTFVDIFLDLYNAVLILLLHFASYSRRTGQEVRVLPNLPDSNPNSVSSIVELFGSFVLIIYLSINDLLLTVYGQFLIFL